MKRNILLLLTFLFFFLNQSFSQFFDNFSDGNFSSSPKWEGDTNDFRVNLDYVLQLNAQTNGTSALWVATSFSHRDLEWRVRVKMDCSPSANNFVRIYLVSDSVLSSNYKRAFFLQLGENLSDDAIELFMEEENQITSVCRGTDGRIANPFEVDIKVTLEQHSHWKIWVDEKLMGNYELDSWGVAPIFQHQAAVGIYCQYTSSNKNKFFFDNFYYGLPQIDTLPPQVINITSTNNYHDIIVHFDENVTPETALKPENYEVVEWGEHPIECKYEGSNFHQMRLSFSSLFKNQTPYHLKVFSIKDFCDNQLFAQIFSFSIQSIKRNEVVIHEIMADPFPAVGLPPSEYVELYNRLDTTVTLSGWSLKIGNYSRSIPDVSIPSKGYIVLVPASSLSLFSDSIPCVPLSLLNITDAGQLLVLYNQFGEVVHFVDFNRNWHENSFKAEGGWSLEMIDSDNPCGGKENWNSSKDFTGGTPGRKNSVYYPNSDFTPPEILRVVVLDSMHLKIIFSEIVLINREKELTLFQIDRNLEIESVDEVSPEKNALTIALSAPIQPHLIYTLTVIDTLCDCVGEMVQIGSSFSFGLTSQAEVSDLVINEVLSNPYGTQDADFIEIFNRSRKIIDLRTVRIGSGGTDFPDKMCLVSAEGYDLFPQHYVAICKNPDLTEAAYYCPYPKRLLKCDSLPNFPNSKGIVHLLDRNFQQLDYFAYNEAMHYPMLTDYDGVSLERINPDVETQNPHNWKSAAESAGFATPGYQNSHYVQSSEITKAIEIIPPIFSPNNDGFDDFSQIHCSFPFSENRVLLQIFNKEGELIKTIANNSIVSSEGCFTWDGTNEESRLVRPDLYVVRLQYWHANGQTKTHKATVGVVHRK